MFNLSGGIRKNLDKSPHKPAKFPSSISKSPRSPSKTANKSPHRVLKKSAQNFQSPQTPSKRTLIIMRNPNTNGYEAYCPEPLPTPSRPQQFRPHEPISTTIQGFAQQECNVYESPSIILDRGTPPPDASVMNRKNRRIVLYESGILVKSPEQEGGEESQLSSQDAKTDARMMFAQRACGKVCVNIRGLNSATNVYSFRAAIKECAGIRMDIPTPLRNDGPDSAFPGKQLKRTRVFFDSVPQAERAIEDWRRNGLCDSAVEAQIAMNFLTS